MFDVIKHLTCRAGLLASAQQGRSGVEEAALWAVLGVTALVGVLIGGTYVHEWLHYRRANALGRRKKQRLQL